MVSILLGAGVKLVMNLLLLNLEDTATLDYISHSSA